jgi:hypothetical protein
MAGPDRAEVAMIQRREFVLSHSLDNGDDRGIDKPESEVGVLHEELSDASVVRSNELEDGDRALLDIGEERYEGIDAQPSSRQPVQLDDHGSRDDQRLRETGEKFGAGRMIGIGPVHSGVERTRVADQRHERGS